MKKYLFFSVCIFFLYSFIFAENLPKINGAKILIVIASKDFRDEEYKIPRNLLEKQGAKITVASSSMSLAKGMLGMKVKPDILLKNVEVKKFSAIIFVGGSGAKEYWDSKIAHGIAKRAIKEGKILAAICIAPVILAKAGILSGKNATVWQDCASLLEKNGANYTGQNVEVSANIITACGPQAAEEFAKEILKKVHFNK